MTTIIPAAPGWQLCALNTACNDLECHSVIAWHVFDGDLPPTPVLAWGTHRPDPYALHFGNAFYVRGDSWRTVTNRDDVIKSLATQRR